MLANGYCHGCQEELRFGSDVCASLTTSKKPPQVLKLSTTVQVSPDLYLEESAKVTLYKFILPLGNDMCPVRVVIVLKAD